MRISELAHASGLSLHRIRRYADAGLLIAARGQGNYRSFDKQAVRDARFMHLGVFPYYPEDGSEAAVLPDQLPDEVKGARRDCIMALQAEISEELLAGFEGEELEVLVDRPHEEWPGLYEGRTWFQAPEVDGGVLIVGGEPEENTLQPVRITKGHAYDLVGEVVEGNAGN